MSVTDDIVEEIVAVRAGQSWKKFSREVIYDYIREETTMTSLVDEIVEKLKKKGIAVGA